MRPALPPFLDALALEEEGKEQFLMGPGEASTGTPRAAASIIPSLYGPT